MIVVPISGYQSLLGMDGIWLFCCVLRSVDLGETWKFHIAAQADQGKGFVFLEPSMDHLEDGRLVMMIRTKSRVLNEAVASSYRKRTGI